MGRQATNPCSRRLEDKAMVKAKFKGRMVDLAPATVATSTACSSPVGLLVLDPVPDPDRDRMVDL
jgi:hypothetical protein